jgi:hypothetical protein
MKTVIDIPDALVRLAKSASEEQGITLNDLIIDGIRLKLKQSNKDKPWIASFGRMRHLQPETDRLNRILAEEFNTLQPEDRA